MNEGRRITIGFIGAGAFFLLASYAINFIDSRKSGRGSPQAQVLVLKETVSLRRDGNPSFEKIKGKKDIFYSDSLDIGSQGEALLQLIDGSKIHLNASTQMTLDLENETTVLFLQKGNVDVDKIGTGGIFIAQNGQRFSLAEYQVNGSNEEVETNSSDNKNLKSKENLRKIAGESTFSTLEPGSTSLSKDYIENTLKSSRPQFYKCFSQLLQKKPGSQGHATLQFTIERSGKVIAPEISFTSIQDLAFKSCLLEALKRIEFNTYKGEPITTLFPLRFE